ncbi:MAG: hypothetical protein AAFX08_06105 [Pseudomonadota bacterium]
MPPSRGVAFLDFEASGLGPRSWPVEVGWAIVGGDVEAILIKPSPDWRADAWDPAAERLHGLSREELNRDGETPEAVCSKLEAAIAGCDVYADAPAWDEFWLHQLYGAARVKPTFRLADFGALMRPIAAGREAEIFAVANACAPRRHRADADAAHLRAIYAAALELAGRTDGA